MALNLNGVFHSFANAKIKIVNDTFVGIGALNFKDSLEGESVQGSGSVPLGETQGDYKAEGDMEMVTAEMNNLRDKLASMHKRGFYALVYFDIVITIDNEVDPPFVIKLVKCRLKGEESSWAKGPAGLTTKIPLSIRWIERDGKRLISDHALVGFGGN